MTYWMDIRFRPHGGGPWYPDTFREFLAAHLGDKPRLFWRDETGKPIQAKPSIYFIGGSQWTGIRATWDEDDRDRVLLLDSSLEIARVLDRVFGGHHALDINEGMIRIEHKKYTRYHIRKLALRALRLREKDFTTIMGKSRRHDPLNDDEIDRVKAIIQADVSAYLGQHFGLIRIDNIPHWGTPVRAGQSYFAIVRDIAFTAHDRIHGPCYAGSLQSQGSGEIKRVVA